MKTILLVIAIFITVWMTIVSIMRYGRGQKVTAANTISMSAGWTAVITHIIGIW